MHATISRQTFTFYPTLAAAQALASKLNTDDPETDYRVVTTNPKGFFIAIFEDGQQVYTL